MVGHDASPGGAVLPSVGLESVKKNHQVAAPWRWWRAPGVLPTVSAAKLATLMPASGSSKPDLDISWIFH
jgi:hypothetical protein